MMNLLRILLFAHLIGAAVIAVGVILTILALVKHRQQEYRRLASGLGVGLGWQLLTGSWLSLVSRHPGTLFIFCRNFGVYFAVIGVTELAVYIQMRRHQPAQPWPVRWTAVPTIAGMAVATVTAIILFV